MLTAVFLWHYLLFPYLRRLLSHFRAWSGLVEGLNWGQYSFLSMCRCSSVSDHAGPVNKGLVLGHWAGLSGRRGVTRPLRERPLTHALSTRRGASYTIVSGFCNRGDGGAQVVRCSLTQICFYTHTHTHRAIHLDALFIIKRSAKAMVTLCTVFPFLIVMSLSDTNWPWTIVLCPLCCSWSF